VSPAGFRIRATAHEPQLAQALAKVLIDCVQGGASVSFMWPLPLEQALLFWQRAINSAQRGEHRAGGRRLSAGTIVGTVQVVFAVADNQPHRADVAKMLVVRGLRRHGLGTALIQAAESAARAAGKTLLVLDTVTGSDAERLYARLGSGWASFPATRCGRPVACATAPYLYKVLPAAD
jgi:GNAT superfamily N-acetyltransferase